MKQTAILLGCASDYLPVIFDVCYETLSISEFYIYNNIQVDSSLDIPVKKPNYSIQIFEPGKSFEKENRKIFFGVNGPFAKKKVFEYFRDIDGLKKTDFSTLIHPRSILASSISLQGGIFIEPGVVISSQTCLGFGVTIKRSSTIGHHCILEDYVEINPGVTISGHVKIESGVIIGSGSVLRNGISIGKGSMIGMGSVVTKDIPRGVVAYGNPCKVIRKKPPRE